MTNGWAHVGRINLSNRMWAWQKQFAESAEQKLTIVTALAIDPQGLNIACHGYSATDTGSLTSYLFVLDTGTGAIVSGLMKMEHSAKPFTQSASMIFNNNGHVFVASGIDSYFALIRYDSI